MADQRKGFAINLLSSGFTGGLAVSVFNPLDCLKVRWMVAPAGSATSMGGFAAGIVRSEGLWRGLWAPGLSANFCSIFISSMGRVGMYPTVRDSIVALRGGGGVGAGKSSLDMLLGGLIAGGLGYFISTPVMMMKTKLQADAGGPSSSGGGGRRVVAAGRFLLSSHTCPPQWVLSCCSASVRMRARAVVAAGSGRSRRWRAKAA